MPLNRTPDKYDTVPHQNHTKGNLVWSPSIFSTFHVSPYSKTKDNRMYYFDLNLHFLYNSDNYSPCLHIFHKTNDMEDILILLKRRHRKSLPSIIHVSTWSGFYIVLTSAQMSHSWV